MYFKTSSISQLSFSGMLSDAAKGIKCSRDWPGLGLVSIFVFLKHLSELSFRCLLDEHTSFCRGIVTFWFITQQYVPQLSNCLVVYLLFLKYGSVIQCASEGFSKKIMCNTKRDVIWC